MFINISASETGNNKGSSSALVQYLEKENKGRHRSEHEAWFNGGDRSIQPHEVRMAIDGNISKLGKNDSKFFLINLSPSSKELAHLLVVYGEEGLKDQLKSFAERMMDEYARNFKREGVKSSADLLWFAKVEDQRYYRHTDKAVKEGIRKVGDIKEGLQTHVQIIVSRKDITGRIKLSPQNTSKGSNAKHSAKLGQFDRKAFKQSGEHVFDTMFGFQRNLKDTVAYASVMKNGSIADKLDMFASCNLARELQVDNQIIQQPERDDLSSRSPATGNMQKEEYSTSVFSDFGLNIQADQIVPEEEKRKRRINKR
ncbi:DUF5712 family protein [Sphingobacterium oryzagri]|uniref:DUF5712 family protein n=1 Tax=Sphingobacterium oryzagri TaxID=3025669 RepID=A0ABY7WL84_9SPHI|nr:DUF5712 family protein [Sphingobacterium sp. KACC 22765]WDF69206.1 DUF5712 family protein [Sphingobacterium sp. KACC 22765]